jgi:hypothetical protein
LEKLIGNLASQNGSNGSASTVAASTRSYDSGSAPGPAPPSVTSTASSQSEIKSGRLIENDNQMIYVSPDHWAAMHDEVCTPPNGGK